MKTASKCNRKHPTNINALKLKKAENELTNVYLKEQTEYIQNQIDKIRHSVDDRQFRIAWQTVNEVSKRKSTTKAKLKAANQEERIQLWKQHFENLLRPPPWKLHMNQSRELSVKNYIKLRQFSQEELDSVLRKIKNRKVTGLDEIPPEVWKTRQFDDILLRQCNTVYDQNIIDRWTKGCILPFLMKDEHRLAKNYRDITITSIAAKIYNALLRNRIEPKIEKILRKNQNGFRRNTPTTSQILTIRRILEGVGPKPLRQQYYLLTSPRPLTLYTEKIWSKYYSSKETIAAIMMLYRKKGCKSLFPGWRHRLLWYCSRCAARRHISPILIYHLFNYVLRMSIDKMKTNGIKLTNERSRQVHLPGKRCLINRNRHQHATRKGMDS